MRGVFSNNKYVLLLCEKCRSNQVASRICRDKSKFVAWLGHCNHNQSNKGNVTTVQGLWNEFLVWEREQVPIASHPDAWIQDRFDVNRHRSKKISKLRVTGLCEGNSPHKWPVTRKMFPLMTSSCVMNSRDIFVNNIQGYLNGPGEYEWDLTVASHSKA